MVKESRILYDIRKIQTLKDAVELGKRFLVCCLDTKNQPTTINVVSVGKLNDSLVHPRQVLKFAILSN